MGALRPAASDKGKLRSPRAVSFSHPAGSPKACAGATGAAHQFGGLTDDQIGHAYGAFGLYGSGDFGAGQHIALYELEPFLRSDIKTFDTCYFEHVPTAGMLKRLHVVQVDGGQPAGTGSGEANLDVEDISALAPQATIDVYEGPSPGTDGTDYDPVDNLRGDRRRRPGPGRKHGLGAVRAGHRTRPARAPGSRERPFRAGRRAGAVGIRRRR